MRALFATLRGGQQNFAALLDAGAVPALNFGEQTPATHADIILIEAAVAHAGGVEGRCVAVTLIHLMARCAGMLRVEADAGRVEPRPRA